MQDFPIEIVLAIIGIAVPVLAFLWEFVLVGRKRLGYRVQMDTPVTGEIESVFPGVLPQLRPAGDGSAPELTDLSVVLMRIENNGATDIDSTDYAVPDAEKVGLHINFPDRRVIGMAVTELSDSGLGDSLRPGTGIGQREDVPHHVGIIDLPKVALNRGDHYKILAILRRSAGAGEAPAPVVRGKIKGGRIAETRSRSGNSPKLLALVGFLVAVVAVQYIVGLNTDDGPGPGSDCVAGKLTLVGSTAFEPAIRDAADTYAKHCAGADFTFQFDGSDRGLGRVDDEGSNPGLLTISDGPKGVGYPNLLARPLALSLFTVIAHPGIGLGDLSTQQLRDLFAGRVANWQQVGGPNLPVRVVDRTLGSGTRETFRLRVLGNEQPPAPPATSCRVLAATTPPGPAFCEAPVTKDMLRTIADLPGSIGYADFSDAAKATDVRTVSIDGRTAGREQVLRRDYPFWNAEYAYSNGEVPAESLAAAFLRFLTGGTGKDVLRTYGTTPCTELPNPTTCTPDR
ncbi:substrate-binding domain-containing protein [Nocardia jejuensis]|uniref:substrate-binding domain-containing protein n=1 Tax=Nocardia jejuensis TaxID=328049 RepID=UPI00082AB0CF|nr:substrate-binding domain-containing protein [Nocardia jejuensis]